MIFCVVLAGDFLSVGLRRISLHDVGWKANNMPELANDYYYNIQHESISLTIFENTKTMMMKMKTGKIWIHWDLRLYHSFARQTKIILADFSIFFVDCFSTDHPTHLIASRSLYLVSQNDACAPERITFKDISLLLRMLTYGWQSLSSRHVVSQHEVGQDTGGAPRHSHLTVDENLATSSQRKVYEVSNIVEMDGDVGLGNINNLETLVGDAPGLIEILQKQTKITCCSWYWNLTVDTSSIVLN